MALYVERTGGLTVTDSQPKVGDFTEHGIIKRIEKISVLQFINYALSGGVPDYGYDQILIDERFVVSTPSAEDDSAGEIVEGTDVDLSSEYAEDVIANAEYNGDVDDGLPCIIGGAVVIYWMNKL